MVQYASIWYRLVETTQVGADLRRSKGERGHVIYCHHFSREPMAGRVPVLLDFIPARHTSRRSALLPARRLALYAVDSCERHVAWQFPRRSR
jgi:hypothetical protein